MLSAKYFGNFHHDDRVVGGADHPDPASAAREYRASTKALEKGRLEESIAHCRKALEADPENAAALNDLGWANYKMQSATEAIKYYSQCAAIKSPLQQQAAKSVLFIKAEYHLQ